jgi:hypothetical protein
MRAFTILKTVAMAAVASIALAAGPVRAEWRKAETAHFIVYGNVSERQIRTYAQKAERFDSLLRAYYPIVVDHEIPKLEIFLADGSADMNRAAPGISSSVAGYYTPNNGRIHAVVNTDAISGDTVLFHEYAHHFMFQMRSNAYPSWFVEGFAEYYGTAEVKPDRIRFGGFEPGRVWVLNQGANTWARMEDVLKWRYTASGRYPAHLYYSQSWAMTHYFMSTPERIRMLGQYLSAVVGGQDSVEAMRAATGRSLEQLQDDVRNYVSGPINILEPQIEIPEPEVTVSTLSPAESALAWLELRLDSETVVDEPEEEDGATRKSESQKAREAREEAENRANLIRDSQAVAARFPGDPTAIRVIARAQRLAHDPAAALTTLQPLLSDSSTDAVALHIAAMALLDQTKTAADPDAGAALRRRASGYLARAMDADPLEFQNYLGLNDTRRGQARYPTQNDVSTLEVAVALAPQSFDARLRLGEAYMARGLNPEAVQVLTPVSNSPHRGSYTRRAREMIAAARNAQGQVVEAAEPPLPEEAVTESDADGSPSDQNVENDVDQGRADNDQAEAQDQ